MISDRQPARMRALGMELAAARVRAGKTSRQAAFGIGMSLATLSRSENAKRGCLATDVAGLLGMYGITGADRQRLLDMAEDLDARMWVEPGDRAHQFLPTLADFEAKARTLFHLAPTIVPGLLQTPAYARALHTVAGLTGTTQDAMVEARIDRQKVLAKLAAPQYSAVLDEAALRRGYGGSEVMVQQINWLIGRAQQPNIDVRVIPFKHGGYADTGPFLMMGFADIPPIVYVEHGGVSGFLDAPQDMALFQGFAARVMRFALSSADSVNFLARMAADYERS
ncbi:helix-turn-helix domain-containing protein [Actinokineospora sp. HUAS TT18]|uniref:helix-turn-helix domain-containing protein n=1 Tax=Actinokineospora sp. HUAS TT18 TaxID=3447451 RepID=UPI003F51EDD1